MCFVHVCFFLGGVPLESGGQAPTGVFSTGIFIRLTSPKIDWLKPSHSLLKKKEKHIIPARDPKQCCGVFLVEIVDAKSVSGSVRQNPSATSARCLCQDFSISSL